MPTGHANTVVAPPTTLHLSRVTRNHGRFQPGETKEKANGARQCRFIKSYSFIKVFYFLNQLTAHGPLPSLTARPEFRELGIFWRVKSVSGFRDNRGLILLYGPTFILVWQNRIVAIE